MIDENIDIMVISTTCLEVPPPNYGGVEQMVYNLSHELGQRGYDVKCVAPQGTEIEDVDVIETVEPTNTRECFKREPEAYADYSDKLSDVDIVIDHSWQKISYIGKSDNPKQMEDTTILGVWHGMPSVKQKPPVEHPNYLSVSRAAAESWADHTGLEVRHAYNGVDFSNYPLRDDEWQDGDYIMTLNRIMPEKGIHKFVRFADQLGINFKVVGEDSFVDDPGYVHKMMAACAMSDRGEYLGTVDQDEKVELLRNAKATFLLPQEGYEEVFGLSAVESMACGTPVVTTDNNGLSEVVSQVSGGTVAYSDTEMQSEMASIAKGESHYPSSEEIRTDAESLYSKNQMAEMYLKRVEEAMQEPW